MKTKKQNECATCGGLLMANEAVHCNDCKPDQEAEYCLDCGEELNDASEKDICFTCYLANADGFSSCEYD